MAVMTVGNAEPEQRPLTVDDLERMPDDGNRYELVDGRLDVSPAPLFVHSRVEHRLAFHLEMACPEDFEIVQGAGINFDARHTHHRIPDVSVVKDPVTPDGHLEDPPELAVEVVSPESRFRDHHTKLVEYARFGIPTYWIITPGPDKPSVIEFRLDGGEYRGAREVVDQEIFETDAPFPVTLVPYWLVADGPWKSHIGGR